MIRRANYNDVDAVTAIYDEIHSQEEAGLCTTGWVRDIYPVRETAIAAVVKKDLYVLVDHEGHIAASARFNKEQENCYQMANWQYEAPDDEIFVMHTLTVSPSHTGRGYARDFVNFYKDLAVKNGCSCLRMDTNSLNVRARKIYAGYGFREAGKVPCAFNGIPDVSLVCLEMRVGP